MIHPRLGLKVRALAKFPGVPKGTMGEITGEDGTHVTVTWSVPREPEWAPATGQFHTVHGLHLLKAVK